MLAWTSSLSGTTSGAIALTVALTRCFCRKSTSHLQWQHGQNTDLQFDGVAKIDVLQPSVSAYVNLLTISALIWHTIFCTFAALTQYRKSLILKIVKLEGQFENCKTTISTNCCVHIFHQIVCNNTGPTAALFVVDIRTPLSKQTTPLPNITLAHNIRPISLTKLPVNFGSIILSC